MRQKSIEEKKARRRRSAVRGVLLFALIQVAVAAVFWALCFIPDSPPWLNLIWLVLAALCLALLVPAALVLKKRFAEIEGGELDAAAEY